MMNMNEKFEAAMYPDEIADEFMEMIPEAAEDGEDKRADRIDALYWIEAAAENAYNKDYWRTLYAMLENIATQHQTAEALKQCRNVKKWYKSEYPGDDLGDDINPDLTFRGVWYHLSANGGSDFYKYIGVGDSIVRERIFDELADTMHLDYDTVYDAWLA